jgi:hypothetical protein
MREYGPARQFLRHNAIHPHQTPQGRTLPILGPWTHVPFQLVPRSEVELLDDTGPHVDVFLSGGVGHLTTSYEARPAWKHFQDAQGSVIRHELITVAGNVSTWSPGSFLVGEPARKPQKARRDRPSWLGRGWSVAVIGGWP